MWPSLVSVQQEKGNRITKFYGTLMIIWKALWRYKTISSPGFPWFRMVNIRLSVFNDKQYFTEGNCNNFASFSSARKVDATNILLLLIFYQFCCGNKIRESNYFKKVLPSMDLFNAPALNNWDNFDEKYRYNIAPILLKIHRVSKKCGSISFLTFWGVFIEENKSNLIQQNTLVFVFARR